MNERNGDTKEKTDERVGRKRCGKLDDIDGGDGEEEDQEKRKGRRKSY